MKTSTKISLGLSIATIAGVYVAVSLSEKIIKKVEHETTRYRTKKVVNKNFNGNEELLDIVDDLSDKQLDTVDKVFTEVKNGKDKIISKAENILERF